MALPSTQAPAKRTPPLYSAEIEFLDLSEKVPFKKNLANIVNREIILSPSCVEKRPRVQKFKAKAGAGRCGFVVLHRLNTVTAIESRPFSSLFPPTEPR